MTYLLDTNHCSYILANDRSVVDQIELVSVESIGISVITEGELIYMAENSANPLDNLSVVEDLIDDLDVYPVDSVTSRVYGKLKALWAVFEANHDATTKVSDTRARKALGEIKKLVTPYRNASVEEAKK